MRLIIISNYLVSRAKTLFTSLEERDPHFNITGVMADTPDLDQFLYFLT